MIALLPKEIIGSFFMLKTAAKETINANDFATNLNSLNMEYP